MSDFDEGLLNDACIFMTPGAAPQWWLSDDVKITAPTPAVAQPGLNDVAITVHCKPAPCDLSQTPFIQVDLFICNPTASPQVATDTANVKRILDAGKAPPGEIRVIPGSGAGQLAPGGQATVTPKWDLPAAGVGPETPGHKCLIARAYTRGLIPGDAIGKYTRALDPHYAQRNICVQTCNSPCGQEVWTAHPEDAREPKNVTFRVAADLQPSKQVLDVALPLLRATPGFRRIVNGAPLKGFGLELPDFPDVKVVDNSRAQLRGCAGWLQRTVGWPAPKPGGAPPSYDAQVNIRPGQYSVYRFVTDLDGAERGDAFVFHLMHMESNQVLSGLTILMLKA